MVATRNITDLNTLVTPAADDIMLIVDRLSATSTEAKQITWGSVIEAVQDIVSSLATDSTTLNFTYDDANGILTAAVNNNTSIQKSIFHDGTTSSTRQEARFVDGVGVFFAISHGLLRTFSTISSPLFNHYSPLFNVCFALWQPLVRHYSTIIRH